MSVRRRYLLIGLTAGGLLAACVAWRELSREEEFDLSDVVGDLRATFDVRMVRTWGSPSRFRDLGDVALEEGVRITLRGRVVRFEIHPGIDDGELREAPHQTFFLVPVERSDFSADRPPIPLTEVEVSLDFKGIPVSDPAQFGVAQDAVVLVEGSARRDSGQFVFYADRVYIPVAEP